jgi:hypothetical protein
MQSLPERRNARNRGVLMHVSEIVGTTFICADCGTTVTIKSEGCSFNYASKRSGEKICNPCALKEKIRHIENDEKVFCYMSINGQCLIDWKGNILARVTANWDIKNNFAGTITYIQAITNNGRKLYGKGPGRGMYVRLRPYK